MPTCAAITTRKREFGAFGIDATFQDNALVAMAEKAARRKTGARSLTDIVGEVARPFLLYLPSTEARELVIDYTVVQNPQAALERMLEKYPVIEESFRHSKRRRKKRVTIVELPNPREYQRQLRETGIEIAYCNAAEQYGRVHSFLPKAMPQVIEEAGLRIDEYCTTTGRKYERSIVFSSEVKTRLVVESLQRGAEVENILYTRIGMHLEKMLGELTLREITIESSIFTDPAGYLRRLKEQK